MAEGERLRCPLCGADRFYLTHTARTVLFAVDAGGEPVFLDTENTAPVDDETEIYCAYCAWHGKRGELRRRA